MSYDKVINSVKIFWKYVPPVLGFYRGFNYHENEPLYTINSLFGILGGIFYSLPVMKETIFIMHEIPKFEAEYRGFKYKGLFNVEVREVSDIKKV